MSIEATDIGIYSNKWVCVQNIKDFKKFHLPAFKSLLTHTYVQGFKNRSFVYIISEILDRSLLSVLHNSKSRKYCVKSCLLNDFERGFEFIIIYGWMHIYSLLSYFSFLSKSTNHYGDLELFVWKKFLKRNVEFLNLSFYPTLCQGSTI